MASAMKSMTSLKAATSRTTVSGRTPMVVKNVSTKAGRAKKTAKGKANEFCFGLPGNTAPMGDFDPLDFLKGENINTVKRYREAELTHGRVAMLASLGFVVGENFNPLFDGSIKGPAVDHFQQVPTPFWLALVGVIAATEFRRASIGWVPPGAGKGAKWIEGPFFQLNDDYTPGAIGWDPLGLAPPTKAEFDIMQTKELNHGRLAMFAILGEIAQEEVDHKELFNLQADGILNDANCVESVCDILEKSGM